MAIENYNWTCSCMKWYRWWILWWNDYCISWQSYCYNNFWYNSEYDYLSNSCKCRTWYSVSLDYSWNQSCVSDDTLCQNDLGYGAKSNWNWYCGCKYWYMMWFNSIWKKQCMEWNTYCSNTYWLNANFNSLSNSCECKSWYVVKINTNWNQTCEKKQNNVYFFTIDVNENDKEALIYDSYNKDYYHITYNVWCYSFDKYIEKNIVINLWTDFDLDTWDKIVLQNDNETCDITDKEKVDSDYKVNCTDTINWYLNGWKCYCNSWYTWSDSENQCKKSIDIEATAKDLFSWIQKKVTPYTKTKRDMLYKNLIKQLETSNTKIYWDKLKINNYLIELIKQELSSTY